MQGGNINQNLENAYINLQKFVQARSEAGERINIQQAYNKLLSYAGQRLEETREVLNGKKYLVSKNLINQDALFMYINPVWLKEPFDFIRQAYVDLLKYFWQHKSKGFNQLHAMYELQSLMQARDIASTSRDTASNSTDTVQQAFLEVFKNNFYKPDTTDNVYKSEPTNEVRRQSYPEWFKQNFPGKNMNESYSEWLEEKKASEQSEISPKNSRSVSLSGDESDTTIKNSRSLSRSRSPSTTGAATQLNREQNSLVTSQSKPEESPKNPRSPSPVAQLKDLKVSGNSPERPRSTITSIPHASGQDKLQNKNENQQLPQSKTWSQIAKSNSQTQTHLSKDGSNLSQSTVNAVKKGAVQNNSQKKPSKPQSLKQNSNKAAQNNNQKKSVKSELNKTSSKITSVSQDQWFDSNGRPTRTPSAARVATQLNQEQNSLVTSQNKPEESPKNSRSSSPVALPKDSSERPRSTISSITEQQTQVPGAPAQKNKKNSTVQNNQKQVQNSQVEDASEDIVNINKKNISAFKGQKIDIAGDLEKVLAITKGRYDELLDLKKDEVITLKTKKLIGGECVMDFKSVTIKELLDDFISKIEHFSPELIEKVFEISLGIDCGKLDSKGIKVAQEYTDTVSNAYIRNIKHAKGAIDYFIKAKSKIPAEDFINKVSDLGSALSMIAAQSKFLTLSPPDQAQTGEVTQSPGHETRSSRLLSQARGNENRSLSR